jgi:uncharacterized membrane protein
MKFIGILPAIALILFSCNGGQGNGKPVSVKDTSVVQDTVVFVRDSTMLSTYADSLPSGAYQGVFPCQDCDGLQQTILFRPDKTFKQEQLIWGRNEIPKISEGSWTRKNGKIELSQNGKNAMVLVKKKDTLFTVSIGGVDLNNSSKYFLTTRSLARDNPVWLDKQKKGIDFAAAGNEPFWNLEIDKERSISFKLGDWKKPLMIPIEKPLITKDSIFYKLKADTTKWTISIYPQFCNDGMSDYLYQYKVSVDYNGVNYRGCGVMLSKNNSL